MAINEKNLSKGQIRKLAALKKSAGNAQPRIERRRPIIPPKGKTGTTQ